MYICIMKEEEIIPKAILSEFKEDIAMYGNHVVYLGCTEDGYSAYTFQYPEDASTGFPEVWLYGDGSLQYCYVGYDALELISSLSIK